MAEVPEVLARQLIRHVADSLEADQAGNPLAIQSALCEAVAEFVPIAEETGGWPIVRQRGQPHNRVRAFLW